MIQTTTMRLCRLALAVALAGCASTYQGVSGAQTGLVVTGETIATIGDHFAAAGGVYQQQCVPAVKVIQLAGFCAGFKDFGPKFQKAYPLAVATFKAAAAANDTAGAQGAEATIVQLSTELTKIGVQALSVLGPK